MWRRVAFALLGFLLVVGSSAQILLDARFPDNPAVEQIFCRFQICRTGWVLEEARRQLWQGGPEGPKQAVERFRRCLERDPASPYMWCDLGEALFESGQAKAARYCLSRAVALGPHIPPILLRVANFHFRLQESTEALFYTLKVLSAVREYDAAIFSSYVRMVAMQDVLRYGLPEDRRAAQSFLQVRADDITTDQGVAFRIFDREAPGRLDLKTEQITGTSGWRKLGRTFAVPSATRLIQVQVIRQPSLKFDNKIRGTAWVDAVKLVPAG